MGLVERFPGAQVSFDCVVSAVHADGRLLGGVADRRRFHERHLFRWLQKPHVSSAVSALQAHLFTHASRCADSE